MTDKIIMKLSSQTSRRNAPARLVFATLMCLCVSTAAFAQDNGAATGMKSLTIGSGARAVGLAETMVADESDPFVLEYNPAGLVKTASRARTASAVIIW